MNVPSITINKVCLSGINAIALADQLIRAGEVEIVVAGGMESMTQAPHLLPKSREGFKYGDTTLVDSMAYDALWDQATAQAMGMLTEELQHRGRPPDPRGAGRVRGPLAPAGRRGVEERRVRRRGRPGDGEGPRRRHPGDRRRGRPRRHHRRVARQAAPGVQQGRHHHRRLRLADLRRRLRGRGDEQGQGRGARPGVARRDRRARPGGRPRLDAAAAARERHREGVRRRTASPPPTSTSSRSTRRSLPSASRRPARSASPRTRSTSTAAPSRSATRSACPAPGSCCTSPTSSSAAAAASARPRCAAAAARATPSSSACPECAGASSAPTDDVTGGRAVDAQLWSAGPATGDAARRRPADLLGRGRGARSCAR